MEALDRPLDLNRRPDQLDHACADGGELGLRGLGDEDPATGAGLDVLEEQRVGADEVEGVRRHVDDLCTARTWQGAMWVTWGKMDMEEEA